MHFVRPPLIRRQAGVHLHLHLRNLYIVPTRFGLLWLAVVGLLQLVAIQMRSNGTLLLSFLLVGLMLLAMHLTHDNLRGLDLQCAAPGLGVAGQPVAYPLLLRSRSARLAMRLWFRRSAVEELAAVPAGEQRVDILWRPQCRGLQRPGPLRIETTAPLGLFVCWSRWEPDALQLIAPARVPGPVSVASPLRRRDGVEEWQDLRAHRPGERLSLVDWASLAKGRRLQAKQFADPVEPLPMLEPAAGVAWEQALEHLADRICRLHRRGERYGLLLPGVTLPPERGLAHRDACLAALASA